MSYAPRESIEVTQGHWPTLGHLTYFTNVSHPGNPLRSPNDIDLLDLLSQCVQARLGVKYCTWTWYLYLSTKYSVLGLVLVLEVLKIEVLVLGLVLETWVLASTVQVLTSTAEFTLLKRGRWPFVHSKICGVALQTVCEESIECKMISFSWQFSVINSAAKYILW